VPNDVLRDLADAARDAARYARDEDDEDHEPRPRLRWCGVCHSNGYHLPGCPETEDREEEEND